MVDEPAAVTEQSVLFPTIGGGRVEFLPMTCQRVPGYDNTDRPVHAPGFALALKILIDARADETAATMELGVLVRPERRDFSGDSFSLALALADKFARFGRAQPDRVVFATGALVPAGLGRLGPIAGFESKTAGLLDHIAAHNLRNAVYVFAADNLSELSEPTRALLEAASEETGLENLPITHISQASVLWRSLPQPVSAATARPALSWRLALTGAVLFAVLAICAGVYWLEPKQAAASMAADPCISSDAAVVGFVPVRDASKQGDFGLNVLLSPANPVYAIGESLTVHIALDHAAYLRVLYLDRNGVATLLYPDSAAKDLLLLPSDHVDLPLHAGGPAGPNLLKVVALATRAPGLAPGARPSPNPEYLLAEGQWQETAICLKITP